MIGSSIRLAALGGTLLSGIILTLAVSHKPAASSHELATAQAISEITLQPAGLICPKEAARLQTAALHGNDAEHSRPVQASVKEPAELTAQRLGLVPRLIRVS